MAKKEADIIVMRTIIRQMLSLIDEGRGITCIDAINWFNNRNIYQKLNEKYGNELLIFEQVKCIGYRYDEILNIVYEYGSDKDIRGYANGLVGLVNMFSCVLSDENIGWTIGTTKFKD